MYVCVHMYAWQAITTKLSIFFPFTSTWHWYRYFPSRWQATCATKYYSNTRSVEHTHSSARRAKFMLPKGLNPPYLPLAIPGIQKGILKMNLELSYRNMWVVFPNGKTCFFSDRKLIYFTTQSRGHLSAASVSFCCGSEQVELKQRATFRVLKWFSSSANYLTNC